MKILVVSWLFSAVRDAITKDGDQAKGMPGFLKAMKYFSENGLDIDYIFISPIAQDANIIKQESKVSYIRMKQIKAIVIKNERLNRYTKNFFLHRALISEVDKTIKNVKYDFIYIMTPETTCVNEYANKNGIPCGARFFGTFLWSYIKENGLKKAKFFMHEELKAYNIPKKFLLTTNDGSNGDDSYNTYCKDKSLYEFQYWVNGLDRINVNEERKALMQNTLSENDIVYVATITRWKRHDRALQLIKKLKGKGINSKLLLVGNCPPDSLPWKKQLENMISELDITENVEFRGSMAREDFLYLAMKSKICPLFQDTTNMGNVFHELFSVGAVIIALNDGSLNGFIENGQNGFLVDSIDEAADICEKIIKDEIDVVQIRKNAMATSKRLLVSWNERFELELQLIKKFGGDCLKTNQKHF